MTDQPQADSAPLEEESAGQDNHPGLDDALSDAIAKASEEVGSDEHEPEPAEPVAEEGAEPGPEEKTADTDSDVAAAAEPVPAGDLIAPEHWPDEQKEAFGGLPRRVQEIWMDRERQIHQYASQLGQKYSAIDRALEPVSEQARLAGRTPDQIISQLVGWHETLQKDHGKIVDLAKLYGIDLGKVVNTGQPDEETFVDPQLEASQREIASLKEQIQELKGSVTGFQTQQQTSQQRQADQIIESFRSERDEAGHLKRPYFDQVRPQMKMLFDSGQAATLDDAYETAILMVPALRQQFIQTQTQAQAAQAATEAEERVRQQQAEAVNKAKNVRQTRSDPVAAPAPSKGMDLDASIKDAISRHGMP